MDENKWGRCNIPSLDEQEAAHVDDKPVKVVPEPDPVQPVGGERHVVGQLREGLRQPLPVCRVGLRRDQVLHQLAVGVLEAADQDVQGAAGVGEEVRVDVLGQDEVHQELELGNEKFSKNDLFLRIQTGI